MMKAATATLPMDGVEAIPKQPRITAINLVRVFVIALVITTHIGASNALYGSQFSGAIWMVSHVSRFLFIALTALVLLYNYGPTRPFNMKTFYLKRFTLVLIPYATWTLIYQVRWGLQQHSVVDFLRVFFENLLTAGAMYHLYFLLISMQLYLLFPLIRYVYGKVKRWPWHILAISIILQVVITFLMQYHPDVPGLSWWLAHPDNYVMTYQLYAVCGLLVAAHLNHIQRFTLANLPAIAWIAATVTVIGQIIYYTEIGLGVPIVDASAVTFPYLIVVSLSYGLLAFGLAFRWVQMGEPSGKPIASVAEDSFGIYLCHPFFLTLFAGWWQPQTHGYITGIIVLVVGLPLVYATSFVFSEIARRTPLSIFLTGRHRVSLKKAS